MIRALIFDFDGLILDTEVPKFQAWQEIYQDHGCYLPFELWAKCLGTYESVFDPFDYLENQLRRSVDRNTILTKRQQRCAELLVAKPVLPGIQDYISDANRLGLRLGLASSSPRRWVVDNLLRLNLATHFTCIKCFEDVPCTKPDPALYQAVLDAFDLPAGQVIALEDSPNGVLAAKRAGLFCVAVPNSLTCRLPLDHADLQLASLADIPLETLLAKMQNNR
tara:strand:- start:46 stop:711 length:666 start_codon:yes stop_codon:yes gene_type:complete